MKITYISWAEDCSRSDHTARELSGTSHMVYWGELGSRPVTVWLKYLGQALRTWRILARERPTAVFVMTPPVFAPLVGWAFCALRGPTLVLDAHTAAFLNPRWKLLQGVQFWLARRAATTIVHNEYLRQLISARGAHATLVADVPVRFAADASAYPLEPRGTFHVAVVCSFNHDEPIAEIIDAARLLPQVQFHITGKARPGDHRIAASTPPNVRLTGFLSAAAYGTLLCHANAAMALTTRNHTMLRGAWEAIYQGTPVIVSNWPGLRESFDEGAVFVDNTREDIVRGVRHLLSNYPTYREGAQRLRERKELRWETTRASLLERISERR